MNGLLGKKLGMTSIFKADGTVVPVTLIEAGPCHIVQVKTAERDGYRAVQLGYLPKKEKGLTKAALGHLKKAGVSPLGVLKEFELSGQSEAKPGDTITVERFTAGEKVDISGISKGRGFAGVMKRHHFSGAQRTHGQSDRQRAPGSLGQSSDPSRVFKGLRMAGHMGNARVTAKNLTVVRVDAQKNILAIKGAVPGPNNGFVEIRKVQR